MLLHSVPRRHRDPTGPDRQGRPVGQTRRTNRPLLRVLTIAYRRLRHRTFFPTLHEHRQSNAPHDNETRPPGTSHSSGSARARRALTNVTQSAISVRERFLRNSLTQVQVVIESLHHALTCHAAHAPPRAAMCRQEADTSQAEICSMRRQQPTRSRRTVQATVSASAAVLRRSRASWQCTVFG